MKRFLNVLVWFAVHLPFLLMGSAAACHAANVAQASVQAR